MSNKQTKSIRWWEWLIWTIVLLIIMILCVVLFKGNETHTSESPNNEKTVAIECTISNPEDGFFDTSQGQNIQHVIKAIFKDSKIDKISYNLEANYDSESIADTSNAIMHGKYNKYMASKSLDPDILKPSFRYNGNTVKVSLLAEIKNLNNETIEFFFLNMDDFQRIKSYDAEKLAKLYEKKGLSCIVNN